MEKWPLNAVLFEKSQATLVVNKKNTLLHPEWFWVKELPLNDSIPFRLPINNESKIIPLQDQTFMIKET